MTGRRKSARPARRPVKRETSAGGVVYRLVGGEPRWLLISDKHGNWGFPKGHLEDGEEPESAALREVREETGLDGLTLRERVAEIEWTFAWHGDLIRKRCHYFLMQSASERTVPQVDEGITQCAWVTAADAEKRIPYANAREVLRRALTLVPADRA